MWHVGTCSFTFGYFLCFHARCCQKTCFTKTEERRGEGRRGPGHMKMLLPQAPLGRLQTVRIKLLAPKRRRVTGNYTTLWAIVVSTPELPACETGEFL